MRLFFTPPVLTVLAAPLPVAILAGLIEGPGAAVEALALSWFAALDIVVLWLILVAPFIGVFGRSRDGQYRRLRVVLVSSAASLCIGALLGFLADRWIPVIGFPSFGTVLGSALAHLYIGAVAAIFLVRDPLFRNSVRDT